MTQNTKKQNSQKPNIQKLNTKETDAGKPGIQNTHYHSQPAAKVLDTLDVDPKSGLSDQEAGHRLGKYGLNKLKQARVRSSSEIFLDQFKSRGFRMY